MKEPDRQQKTTRSAIRALEKQLLSMAGMVESGFAESILALIEGDAAAAKEVRQEDYKAHKVWQQTEAACVALLAGPGLSREEVCFVCAAIQMAMDLKLMADESLRISQQIKDYPARNLQAGPATETLPRMVEIAQEMFNDSIECFVNRDAGEARSLHAAYQGLDSLTRELIEQVKGEMSSGRQSSAAGISLILTARSVHSVGQHALDMANHVSRLLPPETQGEKPAEEQ